MGDMAELRQKANSGLVAVPSTEVARKSGQRRSTELQTQLADLIACFGLLKVTGFAELNGLRQELGVRFAKSPRAVQRAPEPHPVSVPSAEAKAA